MAKKKKETSSNKQLKENLKKIQEDWEELSSHEELSHDPRFLGTLANDIIALEHDSADINEDEIQFEAAAMAHHFISTPWGAPFASNSTLLDAALSFQHQPAQESDLSHLMEDFHYYGHQFEHQMVKVFAELLEDDSE